MSNPQNGFNTNTAFNRYNGSYFNNDVDVSGGDIINRTGNLYLADNSSIYTSNNQIQFNEEFQFCDFVNNVNVLGQLKNTYNAIEYDVGLQCEKTDTLVSDVATISPIVYDTQFKTTGFYWDSGLSTTVFNNNASFPNASISSTAINNTSFVSKSGAETIDGIKTFNSAPVMSGGSITTGSIPVNRVSGIAVNGTTAQSISSTKTFSVVQNFTSNLRLDGSLLVGTAGNVILVNSNLQKIAYISDTTEPVGAKLTSLQNSINTINTNLSGYASLSADNTFLSPINTFNNTLNLNGSLKINNTLIVPQSTLFKLEYLANVSSDIQNQINTINGVTLAGSNIFTALNQFTNNIRLDGSLIVNNNGTTLTNSTLNKIQYLSNVSSDVNTSITNLNTSVSTLNTKTTKMSYMSVGGINTTTILDGLISQTFSFTTSINNISTTKFNWGLLNLTSDVQNQINDVNLDLGETNTRVSSVENKTQKQSYNSSTLTTSFSNNLEFTGTLNNISTTIFGYLSGASENIQSAINSLKTRMTSAEKAINPTGTIIQSVSGDTATNGYEPNYLLCDGRDVSRTTYQALFNTIGIQYGWNNNATQFRLPDFRGVFLRGMGSTTRNNGVTYSSATNAYDFQEDKIQNHTHSGQNGAYLGTNTSVSTNNLSYQNLPGYVPNSYGFDQTGTMNSGRSSTSTYPANFGVYYYIKT